MNKTDLLSPAELAELTASLSARFPGTPVLTMSALTGEGVDAWLQWLQTGRPAGGKIVEVDYDTYAAGEAALGWLNASAKLHANARADWAAFAKALLEGFVPTSEPPRPRSHTSRCTLPRTADTLSAT